MARDTPGRDAFAMRQAARKKTLTMPIGRVNTDELKAATTHKPGTLRQYQLPKRAPARNVAIDAFKALGLHPKPIKQTLSDAKWSFTHPKERLLGQGRAKEQSMTWVGALRGGGIHFDAKKPSWRVPTNDPEWEIVRNKSGDLIAGLMGLKPYEPINLRKAQAGVVQAKRGSVRRYAKAMNSLERRTKSGEAGADDLMMATNLRQLYEVQSGALRSAALDRRNQGIPWAFSAVKPGTREAHATLNFDLYPHKVDVDVLSELYEAQGRHGKPPFDYQAEPVPNPVMMQLMMNALGPEKDVYSFFANQELRALGQARARQQGFNVIDKVTRDDPDAFEWLPRSQRGPDYVDPDQAVRDMRRLQRRQARLARKKNLGG
jgi:hypothetical protein